VRDLAKISEDAVPTDAISGLLNSQVSFFFHLVFFIAAWFVKRTSNTSCYKQSVWGHWAYVEKTYPYVEKFYEPDFLNRFIDRALAIHLICFFLLLAYRSLWTWNLSGCCSQG
jgi:hypothetical protein